MKAAVLHAIAKPPRFEDFPDPVAGQNEAIVTVRAASLKPVDKQMADGSHYAAPRELPAVCGLDGVGLLEDGTRVFFGGPRAPYGGMAQRTVAHRMRCFPLPDTVDDITAAAIFNPGLSAWGALKWRAELSPGQSALILGATGVTGKLAIQTAKLLGARRVVAAGRNESVLASLHELGADSTIRIAESKQELIERFSRELRNGVDVIVDYLWGPPTEALLAAIARSDLQQAPSRMKLVEVGQSAGAVLSLEAAVLRSSRLEILGAGTGNAPISPEVWVDAIHQMLANVARGALRIETERVALADVEAEWARERPGRRVVFIP